MDPLLHNMCLGGVHVMPECLWPDLCLVLPLALALCCFLTQTFVIVEVEIT